MPLPKSMTDDAISTLHVHQWPHDATEALEERNRIARLSGAKPIGAPNTPAGRAFIDNYVAVKEQDFRRRAAAIRCAQTPAPPAPPAPLVSQPSPEDTTRRTRTFILDALASGGTTRAEAPLRDAIAQVTQEAALPPAVQSEFLAVWRELVFNIRRAVFDRGASAAKAGWLRVVQDVLAAWAKRNPTAAATKDLDAETREIVDTALPDELLPKKEPTEAPGLTFRRIRPGDIRPMPAGVTFQHSHHDR